jgi:prevent-host-death family protein
VLREHWFVPDKNPNHKGAIAEAVIAAEAIKLGLRVLKPAIEHEPYDLAFDLGGRLLRVQCKWAQRKGAVVYVHTARCRTTGRGFVRSTYLENEIDAIAVYCQDLDRCYLLPAIVAAGTQAIHLRLQVPRNRQRAAINWAADYELQGAIAQLEERLSGTQKVAGSSPASSTQVPTASGEVVGAHEFRNRFGWYMERAKAGEAFLVTRRGKPYVRLVPAVAEVGQAEST